MFQTDFYKDARVIYMITNLICNGNTVPQSSHL